MLDSQTKNVLDLSDIKEVMITTMLNRYNEKELSRNTINKFTKYLNKQQKGNNSKNSIDNRIASLYLTIQKQYEDFVELNAILSELD